MIIGTKVYLRPIVREDVKILNEWKNDEETYKYLGGGFIPLSIDQHSKWIETMIDTTGNDKRFIICDKQDAPVGMVGLYDINWIHRTCEIGVYIGNKDARGKGYGREACQLAEQFAAEYLNIRKIKLNVVSDNEVAVHMWESLGYRRVGEYIKERFIKGEYRNLTLMEKFTHFSNQGGYFGRRLITLLKVFSFQRTRILPDQYFEQNVFQTMEWQI